MIMVARAKLWKNEGDRWDSSLTLEVDGAEAEYVRRLLETTGDLQAAQLEAIGAIISLRLCSYQFRMLFIEAVVGIGGSGGSSSVIFNGEYTT